MNTAKENEDSVSSVNRFSNKHRFGMKSRNHPYDPEGATSFNDFSYSPLIKGLRSVKQGGAYMNSFIGNSGEKSLKQLSIRAPGMYNPEYFQGRISVYYLKSKV